MGLLSGLSSLGLGNLENLDVFGKEEKEKEKANQEVQQKPAVVDERDLIFDKTFQCPVCEKKFVAKIMKSGKAKVLGTDFDLKPKYEGIDATKYDVLLCENCGYAVLGRFFGTLAPSQAKAIRETISNSVKIDPHRGDLYSYTEAYERYKLCLANAVVKKAKNSEKAYICLKSAWLVRGYAAELAQEGPSNASRVVELNEEEENYLQNALEGFTEAETTEHFPICGMDQYTLDYLLAQLNFHFKKYEEAGKIVGRLLTDRSTSTHIKNKAFDLKEQIVAAKKNEK